MPVEKIVLFLIGEGKGKRTRQAGRCALPRWGRAVLDPYEIKSGTVR